MSTVRLLDKPSHQRDRERRAEAVAIVASQPLKWRMEPKRAKNIIELIRVHLSTLPGLEKNRRFAHLLSYIFHGRALAAP